MFSKKKLITYIVIMCVALGALGYQSCEQHGPPTLPRQELVVPDYQKPTTAYRPSLPQHPMPTKPLKHKQPAEIEKPSLGTPLHKQLKKKYTELSVSSDVEEVEKSSPLPDHKKRDNVLFPGIFQDGRGLITGLFNWIIPKSTKSKEQKIDPSRCDSCIVSLYAQKMKEGKSRAKAIQEINAQFGTDAGFWQEHNISPKSDEWLIYTPELLKSLEGKSIFLHFTAKWCLACQAEGKLLDQDFISEALKKDVVLVEVNLDDATSEELNLLKSYHRRAIPLYVSIAPNGDTLVYDHIISTSQAIALMNQDKGAL